MQSPFLRSTVRRFAGLQTRKTLARFILGCFIVLAGISAARRIQYESPPEPMAPDEPFWVLAFDDLNQLQSVHVFAHSLGFVMVAMILGPWGDGENRGSAGLVLAYTATASVIWETVQAVVWSTTVVATTHVALWTHIERDYNWGYFAGTLFDFLVNGLAALFGLALLRVLRSRMD